MSQPNFSRLETAVTTVVEEVKLIPNLPIVIQANQMAELITQITSMRDESRRFQASMKEEFRVFKASMQEESRRFQATMQEQFRGLQTEMRQEFRKLHGHIQAVYVLVPLPDIVTYLGNRDHNSQARLHNSSVIHNNVALIPLVNENNQAIPNFPKDLEAVVALTGMI